MKSTVRLVSPVVPMLLLVFWGTTALGQCPASLIGAGTYQAGQASVTPSGCLPLHVAIRTTLPGAANPQTIFDYRGGAIESTNAVADSTHVYSRPGTYTIVQISEKAGQKYLSCHTVEVPDSLAPEVRAVPCANGGVQLVFDTKQPTPYPTYQVDWGDTEIKGYPGYGKSISYTYAARKAYTIRVRGVHTPGQCRGAVTRLTFLSPDSLPAPVVTEARMSGATTLDLTLKNSLDSELRLLRGTTKGVFEPTGQVLAADQVNISTRIKVPDHVCFRLEPADSCLAALRSKPVCVADFTLAGNAEANELRWKIPDFQPGFQAFIRRDDSDWRTITSAGSEGLVEDRGFACGRDVCYQLVVRHQEFAFYSQTQCRMVPIGECIRRPPLYIPEAFSPNGDGINDLLEIRGVTSAEFDLTVFNAWGTVVFRATNPDDSWNGEFKSQKVPAGTYAFRIRILDGNGEYFIQRGNILVLR